MCNSAINPVLADTGEPKYSYSQWLASIPAKKYGLKLQISGISGDYFYAVFHKAKGRGLGICYYNPGKQVDGGYGIDFVWEDGRPVNYSPKTLEPIASDKIIEKNNQYRPPADYGLLLIPPPALIKNRRVFLEIQFPDRSMMFFDLGSFGG